MEPIFIIAVVITSFFLGIFVHQRVCRTVNLDDKCKQVLKKHRDIKNWLKSELVQVKKKKLGKRIDPNRVKLLELLISRLEK